MPRTKVKRGRRPARGPNPYLPSLLAMSMHWSPEQVASVISELDNPEYQLSEAIVLKLARLPQMPRQASDRPAQGVDEEPGQMGRCGRCHYRGADVAVQVGENVEKLCEVCYEELLVSASRSGRKADPNREEEDDGQTEGDDTAGSGVPES